MSAPRSPQQVLADLLRQKSSPRAMASARLPQQTVQERFAARVAEIASEKADQKLRKTRGRNRRKPA